VFRRNSGGATDETAQDSPGAQSPDGPADARQPRSQAEAVKGRPTPKRSEAERKRRQPITGSRPQSGPRTPEDKARARTERARKYEAANRGEAWALNPKDRGAARGLARDYIDSKRRISEYFMYIIVLLLIAAFAGGSAGQKFVSPMILVLAVLLLIESQLVKAALRRLLNDRMPGEPMRGLTLYAMMRALQIRKLRVPAPRVRPGGDF
jgi:Protein of unknown function (DUF3043)